MFPKTSAKDKKGGKCKQVRQTMGMENASKTKAKKQGNEEAGSAHLHKIEIPEGENKEGNL